MKPPEKMEATAIIHSTPEEEYDYSGGKYNCLKCNYHSPRLDKILQHIHAHKGKLICKICGKAFIKTCDLVRHNHAHAMGRVKADFDPGQGKSISNIVTKEVEPYMDIDDVDDISEDTRQFKNVLSSGIFEPDKTQDDEDGLNLLISSVTSVADVGMHVDNNSGPEPASVSVNPKNAQTESDAADTSISGEKNKEKNSPKASESNTDKSPGKKADDNEDDFSCIVVDTETGVSIDVLEKSEDGQREHPPNEEEAEPTVGSDDDVTENGANISGPISETDNMDTSPTASNGEQATESFSIASGPVPNLAHLAQSGLELEAIGMDSEEFANIAEDAPIPNSKEEAFFASNHKGNYRCKMCSYVTSNPRLLTRHLRAHTRSNKVCRFCNKAFERPSDLVRHEERHNIKFKSQGVNPLTRGKLVLKHCTKCKFATLDAGVLYQHAKKVHGAPMRYRCNICHKKFTSVMSVKNHQKFMHSISDGDKYTQVLADDDGLPTGVPGKEKEKEQPAECLPELTPLEKPKISPKSRKRAGNPYPNNALPTQYNPYEIHAGNLSYEMSGPKYIRMDSYEHNILTNTGLLECVEVGDNELKLVSETENIQGNEDVPFVCTLPQAKYVAKVTSRGCGAKYQAVMSHEYMHKSQSSNIRVLIFEDEDEQEEKEREPEKRVHRTALEKRMLREKRRLDKEKRLNSSWPLPSTGPRTLDSRSMQVKETDVLPNKEMLIGKAIASPLQCLPQTSSTRPIPKLTSQPLVNVAPPNVSHQNQVPQPIINKLFSSPIMTIPGSEQRPMMNQIKSGMSESSAETYLTGVRSHKAGHYSCDECSYSTAQPHKMEQHKKAHYLGKHICKICRKAFIKTSDLTRHWVCHQSVFQSGEYHCDSCAYSNPSANEVEAHMKTHYISKSWTQNKDAQKTKNLTQLSPGKVTQQHHTIQRTDQSIYPESKSNENMGKFVCKVCKSTFISPGALERHQVIDHIMADRLQGTDSDTLSCLYCNKSYNDPFRLYKHEQFHRSRKHAVMPQLKPPVIRSRKGPQNQNLNQNFDSYFCVFCKKGFSTKSTFDDHMNIHTGVKPYRCLNCGESFAMRNYLEVHVANGCHGKV